MSGYQGSTHYQMVVTGSRRRQRTVTDSMVPIDILSSTDLQTQGAAAGDMNDILSTLLPSFNVTRFPIDDGTTFVRPPSLRGLASDQTLVLINSKRRHRSALVQLSGRALSRGAQSVDLAIIPSIAIEQVEVLRDGAAAQYGSDAIAGVLNFILKEHSTSVLLNTQYGEYAEGDGEQFTTAINFGIPLTSDGFLNFSAEYVTSRPTSRGTQRADAAALIASGEPFASTVPTPAQTWGDPDVKSFRSFWNSGVDLFANTELYFFGNFAETDSDGSFNYRNPQTAGAFRDTPNDPNDLSQGTFNFNSVFPGGYTPRFGSNNVDASQVVGIRGTMDSGFSWDISGSYAYNKIVYNIESTLNPSLGLTSPTQFKPGNLIQTEANFNLDFSYPLELSFLSSPLNMATGFEYRKEQYEIETNDPLSFAIGPFAKIVDDSGNPVINPDTGEAFQGLPVGSDGFPGYSHRQAGTFSQENIALYLDFEAYITDQLQLGLAGRYENFNNYGDTFNWKTAMRFEFNEYFAIRSSVSTGFRAPSVGQANTTNVSTVFVDNNPNPVARGTIPPTNPVAAFLGAKPLEPEESLNINLGFTTTIIPKVNLSLDLYHIEVDNRIALSANIDIDPQTAALLEASGVPGANEFAIIRYFTNDFDTTTQGVDLVANTELNWDDFGSTEFVLGFNYNNTKVTSYTSSILDRETRLELEDQLPKTRLNLSAKHFYKNFSLLLRANRYGEFVDPDNDPAKDQTFSAEWILDIEASYQFAGHYTVSVGGSNILNTYPDEAEQRRFFGVVYPATSPFGFNGAFWYTRLSIVF